MSVSSRIFLSSSTTAHQNGYNRAPKFLSTYLGACRLERAPTVNGLLHNQRPKPGADYLEVAEPKSRAILANPIKNSEAPLMG